MDESPVAKIVQRIAEQEGVDPLDLAPLYDAIDGDTLNLLVRGEDGSLRPTPLEVEFEYHGYDVVVTGSGDIDTQKSTAVRA